MRNVIAASVVALLASSSIALAAQTDRPLVAAAVREARRVASAPNALRQTPAEPSPPEEKRWMERHPVWFGLIVGAGVGAAWSAATCEKGCFPIGASGAAMVGSWYGAGVGALIGWGVGRAD